MGNVKRTADDALSAACRDYKKCLEKYCRVRLGEAADSVDDCVQETFYIYYKKLLNGEIIEKPKAFLYRTADNMIKRKLSEHYKTRRTPYRLMKQGTKKRLYPTKWQVFSTMTN